MRKYDNNNKKIETTRIEKYPLKINIFLKIQLNIFLIQKIIFFLIKNESRLKNIIKA